MAFRKRASVAREDAEAGGKFVRRQVGTGVRDKPRSRAGCGTKSARPGRHAAGIRSCGVPAREHAWSTRVARVQRGSPARSPVQATCCTSCQPSAMNSRSTASPSVPGSRSNPGPSFTAAPRRVEIIAATAESVGSRSSPRHARAPLPERRAGSTCACEAPPGSVVTSATRVGAPEFRPAIQARTGSRSAPTVGATAASAMRSPPIPQHRSSIDRAPTRRKRSAFHDATAGEDAISTPGRSAHRRAALSPNFTDARARANDSSIAAATTSGT